MLGDSMSKAGVRCAGRPRRARLGGCTASRGLTITHIVPRPVRTPAARLVDGARPGFKEAASRLKVYSCTRSGTRAISRATTDQVETAPGEGSNRNRDLLSVRRRPQDR